jgi:CMP-N-acetylneuraminic acid synthetase
MSVLAVIPARGGSKGVARKNLRPVGGIPLIGRAIAAANAVPMVDLVVVSTDDDEIAFSARSYGAEVVARPADLATDTATSESALLHVLQQISGDGVLPDVLVFIQATSPFIDTNALERAISRVLDGTDDVVFSAIETYAFLWRDAEDGATGVNHDHSFRPRRQDREPHFQETGAFYVMRTEGFTEAGFRFFGKVGIELVDESGAIEIDNEDQLVLAGAIARSYSASAGDTTSTER